MNNLYTLKAQRYLEHSLHVNLSTVPTPMPMPMSTTTITDKRVTGNGTAYSCAKKQQESTYN